MEKFRTLWEGPRETLKTAGDSIGSACWEVSGFKSFIANGTTTIKKKLNDWVNFMEVSVHAQLKLMERSLNFEVDASQSSREDSSQHLVSLGYVKGVPIASKSAILCDDLDTIKDVARTVTLKVCDFEEKPCNLIDRFMELRAVLVYNDGEEAEVSVSRAVEYGHYNICFRAMRSGRAVLSVKLHGVDVTNSPQRITIYPMKMWTEQSIVASFFGAEGVSKGEFQRPWGVSCDRRGRLLVADRTNNRVQVFRDDGAFLFEFGKKGDGPGEFQLVSAVAGAPNGDLVCVDKDNHRLQVFDEHGTFKFSFGKLGSKPGEFHYPWDVDVSARGDIAVTDSRNCRVQFFDRNGKFLKSFDKADRPEIDSPRGVTFINTSEVVVSDFNKHQLVIVNTLTKHHRVICCEGSKFGQLKRPQGVAWHPHGFIVVGDSRNNRIQAVDLNGRMVWEYGGAGAGANRTQQAALDRPCGVTVTKKGSVVAVDFGNNRVVVLL